MQTLKRSSLWMTRTLKISDLNLKPYPAPTLCVGTRGNSIVIRRNLIEKREA